MKTINLLLLATLGLSSAVATFAAIPSSGPGGENPQGLFATYFSTLATNPCTSTTVLTGFNSTAGSDFLKATCTSFGNLLGAFFATFPAATEDEVLAGFNPTTGAPIYKVATSVWKNVVGGITYSSGNVGIGTYDPQATLHVSGSLFATNFADTTNGTWFPWTNGNNYIRGTTTYLSGFIVDEQDSRFYLNPAETNVLKNVAVSGSITGPAPTASNHLATKAYVDAAVSAGGGGGGLNVYKSDGTTLLGRLVRYDEGGFVYGWTPDQSEFSYYVGDPNTQLSFIYADTEGIIRQAIRSERAAVATKSHFSEPDCGGTEYWSQQNGSYVRWCAANWFSYYAAPYHLNQKTGRIAGYQLESGGCYNSSRDNYEYKSYRDSLESACINSTGLIEAIPAIDGNVQKACGLGDCRFK